MNLQEYGNALSRYVCTIKTNERGTEAHRQAAHNLAELEEQYNYIIPVKHQPITLDQHQENFLQYNPKAIALGKTQDKLTSIMCLAVGMFIGGIILKFHQMSIMIGLATLVVMGIWYIINKFKLDRMCDLWLATNPTKDREIWHIIDYLE